MSGGFFRGTSADQDTRFSNKQSKLLKSQKFAPELEHLVDIGKVKMDVMRPWIASRVTELLGFEDEVLINFIYGLLDGKEVNGKEVQISLTGFMEKNTVKFMKELWSLLLSAQSNASGVPQQFLDAKEEETRKKQEETDRIANEIQKKREKERENRELEQDRLKKMANGVETKPSDASMEPGRLSRQKNDKEYKKINGNRGRYRERSRSVSKSSDSRGRSISSDRSPRKRSITPRRRHSPSVSPRGKHISSRKSRSPAWRRLHSPYRRRSRSPVRRRSLSPRGRRSPSPRRYRRSPSPRRYRRSPTPTRHRRSPSPVRRRSPSPVRRRSPSPVRRRSPSPVRRKSPYSVRRRSPSPSRYGSPRAVQHRSPPTPRRRSPSPSRRRYRRSTTPRHRPPPSPVQKQSSFASHRSSSLSHHRSQSPYGSSSPSPVRHQELRKPAASIRESIRSRESFSPAEARGSGSSDRRLKDQKDIRVRLRSSSSSERSPVRSKSPPVRRKRNDSGYISPYESPVRPRREQTRDDGSSSLPRKSREQYSDHRKTSKEDEAANVIRESRDHTHKSLRKESSYSSAVSKQKYSPRRDDNKVEYSVEELGRHCTTDRDANAKCQELKREKSSLKGVKPEGPPGKKPPTFNGASSQIEDGAKEDESVDRKTDHKNGIDTSGSEETEQQKTDHKRKSKHRKSHKHDIASNDSYSDDSEYEERKEAKRRKKEAKKLRKEEKRRKREERRQRRRERRAEKLKSKDHSDSGSSDDEHMGRRESHRSDDEGDVSEEKKLEIELRNKALESLKAKKGINH